jgi:prepilin peptidase CpaA
MGTTALGHHPLPLLQWGVVLGASLGAAILDAREHRIPNALTFPVFLAGLAAALLLAGWLALADSLAGALLLALPYVLLFAFGGGGAGDAKMMAALGAWLGLSLGAVALVCVSASGAVLGLCFALMRRRALEVGRNISLFTRLGFAFMAGRASAASLAATVPTQDDGVKMPYGAAILAGSLLAYGVQQIWLS